MRKVYCIFMCLYPYLMLLITSQLSKVNYDFGSMLYEIIIGSVFLLTFIMALILGHGKNAFSPKKISYWAMIIKISHLPFFAFLGLLMGLAGVIAIIPVPFMIFVGISFIMAIGIVITYFMVHSGMLGMSAVFNAKKVGAITGIWVLVFIVLMFVPGVDIAALAYLYFKTRNCE